MNRDTTSSHAIVIANVLSDLLLKTEKERVELAHELSSKEEMLDDVSKDLRRAIDSEKHLKSEVERLTQSLARVQADNKSLRCQMPFEIGGNKTPFTFYLSQPDKLRNAISFLELSATDFPSVQLIDSISVQSGWSMRASGHLVEYWFDANPPVPQNKVLLRGTHQE